MENNEKQEQENICLLSYKENTDMNINLNVPNMKQLLKFKSLNLNQNVINIQEYCEVFRTNDNLEAF